MEKVECMEQAIIQHIRTAGMVNKSKETSLVDEFLDLRRERRKFCAATLNELENLKSRNHNLEDELKLAVNAITICKEEYKKLSRQHESSIKESNESIISKYQELFRQQELSTKQSIIAMQQEYEAKIKLLETKVNEVFEEKNRSDKRDATEMANNLVRKAAADIEFKYVSKIKEYKSTILALASREKDFEGTLNNLHREIEKLKDDKRKSDEKIDFLESQAKLADKKAQEMELRNCELSATIEQLTTKHQQFSEEKFTNEEKLRMQLLMQAKQHSDQLTAADEKVRRLLDARDQEAQRLTRKLEESEARRRRAEGMLKKINEDIDSANVVADRNSAAHYYR